MEGCVDGRELEVEEGLGAESDEHGDEPGRRADDEGHSPPLRRPPFVGRPPPVFGTRKLAHVKGVF